MHNIIKIGAKIRFAAIVGVSLMRWINENVPVFQCYKEIYSIKHIIHSFVFTPWDYSFINIVLLNVSKCLDTFASWSFFIGCDKRNESDFIISKKIHMRVQNLHGPINSLQREYIGRCCKSFQCMWHKARRKSCQRVSFLLVRINYRQNTPHGPFPRSPPARYAQRKSWESI